MQSVPTSFMRRSTKYSAASRARPGQLSRKAKPSGPGPFPGVVLVHHLPGWSEFYIETTRRFAHHGYLAICANLYERAGEGNPDDVAAKVRADGGIPDAQMVGDTEAAVKWMRAQSNHNGKVGIFGSCSGGRHGYIPGHASGIGWRWSR